MGIYGQGEVIWGKNWHSRLNEQRSPPGENEDDTLTIREAWLGLEALRREKPAEAMDVDGVTFSPEALLYLPEGVLVAAQLVYEGLLPIIGQTPIEGKPTDSQNFFIAARRIAHVIRRYVHNEMLTDL
jgi:hypothetical protein